MNGKQYEYTVTFRVGERLVSLNVCASCVGNAKAIARGRLEGEDYDNAEAVSVFAGKRLNELHCKTI